MVNWFKCPTCNQKTRVRFPDGISFRTLFPLLLFTPMTANLICLFPIDHTFISIILLFTFKAVQSSKEISEIKSMYGMQDMTTHSWFEVECYHPDAAQGEGNNNKQTNGAHNASGDSADLANGIGGVGSAEQKVTNSTKILLDNGKS